MKNAYLSVLIYSRKNFDSSEIQSLGKLIQSKFRKIEIIYVSENPIQFDSKVAVFDFPLTSLVVYKNSSRHRAIVAGLGRSVGDFILFWDLDLNQLSVDMLANFVLASDQGAEFVSLKVGKSKTSKLVYRILNFVGITSNPYSRFFGGLLSRRLVSQVLSASIGGAELDLILANTNLNRIEINSTGIVPPKERLMERIRRVGSFLTKGTKFGTLLPLLLALFSSFIAIAAAVYSVFIYVLEGKTPEGWTTLMVLVGFGQSCILLMLALLWNQLIEMQSNRLSSDVTEEVQIFGPRI